MSLDERSLLLEQALRSLHAPRRSAWLDGPIWWLGPIAIFAALGALLIATPWPRSEPAREPAQREPDAVAWSSTRISKD